MTVAFSLSVSISVELVGVTVVELPGRTLVELPGTVFVELPGIAVVELPGMAVPELSGITEAELPGSTESELRSWEMMSPVSSGAEALSPEQAARKTIDRVERMAMLENFTEFMIPNLFQDALSNKSISLNTVILVIKYTKIALFVLFWGAFSSMWNKKHRKNCLDK